MFIRKLDLLDGLRDGAIVGLNKKKRKRQYEQAKSLRHGDSTPVPSQTCVPGERERDQLPYLPTIETEQTFWCGKPPRLCVSPTRGVSLRCRSPARPCICR